MVIPIHIFFALVFIKEPQFAEVFFFAFEITDLKFSKPIQKTDLQKLQEQQAV